MSFPYIIYNNPIRGTSSDKLMEILGQSKIYLAKSSF